MENIYDSDLYHHGIVGMKWGIRRYQNSDGSLTSTGKKRYANEWTKLKEKEKKIKAKEKKASNNAKVKAALDKLNAKKAELSAREKALKGNKKAREVADELARQKESIEQQRTKLLKSTNAKELYKNRHLLTNEELNERINRIDLENRLQSKIPVEQKKTIKDYLNKTIDFYNTVDKAYSTVNGSSIGKQLAKKLGISNTKEFNLEDFVNNINYKSNQDIANVAKRIKDEQTIRKAFNGEDVTNKTLKIKNAKFNKKQSQSDNTNNSENTKSNKSNKSDDVERVFGEVVGEGTSSSKFNKSSTKKSKPEDYYDPIDPEDYVNNVSYPVSTRVRRKGRLWLEDKYGI